MRRRSRGYQEWVRVDQGRAIGASATRGAVDLARQVGRLTELSMQGVEFEDVELERAEDDWLHCWVDGTAEHRYLEWNGGGGSANLCEMLSLFRSWVDGRTNPA